MLMIRLQRIGRKNEPHFRVVITDKANGPKSGKFLEVVGSYNPKAGTIELKKDRIKHYLAQGVQPSGTVHNFLVDAKLIDGKKRNVLPKKTRIVKEGENAPAAEAAPAPAEVKEETAPAAEVVEEAPAEVAPEAAPEAKVEEQASEATA